MQPEENIVIQPKASAEFVATPYIKDIIERAMHFIKAGFPIHFRGCSGTGKTTLALRIAELLSRPVIMISGDEQLTTTDLIGNETGYHISKLRDNFISSVLKIDEEATKRWVDNRLTIAIQHGYTLIYDEFTRSRPEANNVLLSVLQEGILNFPMGNEHGYIKVHPEFHAIFTSNPEEYAGVHRSQDALRDRMVTLDLDWLDENTEVSITAKKSNLKIDNAKKIVKIVRFLRENGQYEFAPTIRSCIMIAKTVHEYGNALHISTHDPIFKRLCFDVLTSETSRIGSKTTQSKVREIVKKAIEKYCSNGKL
jgi:gas vesicle protein GvpN